MKLKKLKKLLIVSLTVMSMAVTSHSALACHYPCPPDEPFCSSECRI